MRRRDFLVTTSAAVAGGVPSGFAGSLATQGRVSQGRALVVDGLLADVIALDEPYLRALQAARVDCVHVSMESLVAVGDLYTFLDAHREAIGLVRTVREIREAAARGRIGVVLGVQHANLLEALLSKGSSADYGPLTALRAYHELGLRIQGIAYNVTNIFGGGCVDPQVGLTRAGRRLVTEVHKLGMILDVGGHTGERTSLDAIEMSAGVPVICSHTNVAALNPNLRATSDRVIEAIARSGGVVGLTAVSDFHVRNVRSAASHGQVSPQADLAVHLDQYDYLKRLVGPDHVGLGPDFVGAWGEIFLQRGANALAFPTEALSEGKVRYVKGFESIVELPNVGRGLRDRGWTKGEIDKVLGENWLRVYQRVWRA
jgi:membrane dipeptidase